MSEHASTLKHRRDAARRRVRRQRASIYEWSEGIHEVEATRVAHVGLIVVLTPLALLLTISITRPVKIYTITASSSKPNGSTESGASSASGASGVAPVWTTSGLSTSPRVICRASSRFRELADSRLSSGYHRMRKKMQAEASQKPRQAQAPLSPPEERRTRTLGPSRNDSISAAPHTRPFYPFDRLLDAC
jgi:hypothetical protein